MESICNGNRLYVIWLDWRGGASLEFNFAVTPTIPENQVDKSKTYFDLKMAPGAKQTVEI